MEKLFPGIGHDETEQMLVRWIYLGVIWAFFLTQNLITEPLAMVLVAQILLAMAHTLHARLRPQHAVFRRSAGIFVDQVPSLVALEFATPAVAPLFFMFGTVSVGYGLRFGPRYCVVSAIVSALGLGLVTVTNPIYRAEWVWMLSIIGLVSLVPLYSAYLSVRLQRRQARMQAESDRLLHAATHDAMTGLVNRAHFVEVLATHLRERVGRRHGMAVLFIDLDGFKRVNDRFGHAAGDNLLCHVARCLQTSVRSGDLVARIGGDEFAILVKEVLRLEEVPLIIDALEARLHSALRSDDTFVGAGASIGSVTYGGESPCPEAETLLQQADAAMYAVKAQHRARALSQVSAPIGAVHTPCWPAVRPALAAAKSTPLERLDGFAMPAPALREVIPTDSVGPIGSV